MPRLAFVDTLKVALIALVIAHHAGQAYGPTGGRWPLFNPERAPILGPFFSVNAGFFMGLFFCISGYFLPRAYDRKGPGAFLKDRFLRLGVPLLATALLLFGPITYLDYAASQDRPLPPWQFLIRVYLGEWQVELGHLWFLAHLLFYAACYTAWRLASPRFTPGAGRKLPVPGQPAILLFALTLAAATFIVRIWYPIDRWEDFLIVIPAEFAHVPQYLSLFVLGIVAYRHDWLFTLPTATGMTWLGIGIAAAVLRYGLALGGLPPLRGGGLDGQALLSATWEALLCVGLSVGLLVLARDKVKGHGAFWRALSANAYIVYVIHIWPVIGLQFALAGVGLPPLIKFALVTLLAVPLCFAIAATIAATISATIRRAPFAQKLV